MERFGPAYAYAIGHALLLGLAVLLWQSFFWAGDIALVLKLAVAALAVLAYARPAAALLVVAGLVPLSRMFTISIWPAYPANATEALVLAFLVGWLSRTWRSSSRLSWPSAALTTPTLLFFGVVLASCIVQVAVLQVWKDYPWSFVQDFFSTFLAREYLSSNPDLRPWAAGRGGFGFVAPAALLLEGLALFLIVIVLSRQDRGFPVRLTRMIVAGALGAAVLNMVEPGTAVITPADPVAALQDALGARTTTFVAKVDTAGSYFVMIIPIAFGAAAVRSRWSFGWLAAGLTITAALWLTGTRAAIIAGLAVAVATVSWVTLRRYFSANRWQIGIMLAIITALLLLTYEAFQFRAESIRLALSIRLWLAETTLGMLASRPLLEFGIGQYRPWSGQFSPPELLAIYPSADAHNYFFQIAGELGAIGLVLFLWLLGAAVLAAWRALRVARADSRLAGTLAGICAFLLSCLGDHALLFAPGSLSFLDGVRPGRGPRRSVPGAIRGQQAKRAPGFSVETQSVAPWCAPYRRIQWKGATNDSHSGADRFDSGAGYARSQEDQSRARRLRFLQLAH